MTSDELIYWIASSGGAGAFPWPPAQRTPYTLPPYQGDRDLWFTPPTGPDLRFLRADAWSMVVPGLPYLPGRTSLEYPERCITGFYPLWDAENRAKIRKQCVRYGYTHLTLWLADIWDALHLTPAELRGYCQELRDDGIWVRAWLGSKLYPDWIPRDARMETWKARLDPYFDALLASDCLNHAVIGGEFDFWNIGVAEDPEPFRIAEYVVGRCAPVGCLTYFHFSTHRTFWGNTPGHWNDQEIRDRLDWARVMADIGVRGMGYQGGCPKEWSIPELQARLADSLGSIDPRFDIQLEEPGPADAQFPANAHPDETEACAIGYAGLITKPRGPYTAHIMGAGNGLYSPNGYAVGGDPS